MPNSSIIIKHSPAITVKECQVLLISLTSASSPWVLFIHCTSGATLISLGEFIPHSSYLCTQKQEIEFKFLEDLGELRIKRKSPCLHIWIIAKQCFQNDSPYPPGSLHQISMMHFITNKKKLMALHNLVFFTKMRETWWFMQCSNNNWSLNMSFSKQNVFPH